MNHSATPHRGFSLIELMISVVIGLLALMFATRLMVSSERSKQTTLGSADSMQNGMQAMFSISRDMAQAGWGLNDTLIGGCDTLFFDAQGYVLPTAARSDSATPISPLGAVLIKASASGSDEVTLYAGSAPGGTGSVGLGAAYTGGTAIVADRLAFNFRQGDVVLVVPDRSDVRCALAQLSSDAAMVSGVQQLNVAPGTNFRFNASGGLGQNYAPGITRIFNLGPGRELSFHTWSLNGSFLQLRATNLAGAAGAAQPVVDNIVALKAQYGFDVRSAVDFLPESGLSIGKWSAAMYDADADGVTGGRGDYARIAAVRLGIVARSKTPDRPDAAGKCTTTPDADRPVLFKENQPKGIAAVPVTPTISVAGDTIDASCYRYRVFETIVPMRNLAWRPTAE